MAHAMDSRRSIVYHFIDQDHDRDNEYALKIFRASFHLGRPGAMEPVAHHLRKLREIDGLASCDRWCITPAACGRTLDIYPELAYSHLMPWMQGTTWSDVHQGHWNVRELSPWNCLQWATSFSGAVAALEAQGLAHCDLNPSNLMVDTAPNRMKVELVGMEDIWCSAIPEEGRRRAPNPEYVHPLDATPGPLADRFPSALLVAEILAWHSSEIQEAFAQQMEVLFSKAELDSRSSPTLGVLKRALQRHHKSLWDLFLRAWESPSPADCPSLTEWHAALLRVASEKIEYAWMRKAAPSRRTLLNLPDAMAVGR